MTKAADSSPYLLDIAISLLGQNLILAYFLIRSPTFKHPSPELRFSATLGEEPEVDVALV